ncbi:helix-turn-helix domain-containing protein [Mucilaginibacter terrae]|uniref:Transcriptional regulator with XRE-family HTH domain n=1 Tax=Mucilaginibacter terrae TaxID=1955052 RepID=A0ABU3GNA6_9SPHI|nr:helix-turn-helix transcriptional regulator [Mucilaginibacter terrae]MDT3401258.1 transcriptional regulator with XRE-family HTH domain [Mucilaginibacter terrae]
MDKIGEKIRIQRLEKNYSQEYMAFMLDISQAAYSKIERCETTMSLPRIYAIAEILQISPFVLMPKPKYGTGINIHFIYATFDKLKRLWVSGVKQKKQAGEKPDTSYRDKSNTESH